MIYPGATVAFKGNAALSLVTVQPTLAVAEAGEFTPLLPGHGISFMAGPQVSLSLAPFNFTRLAVSGVIDGGGFDNSYERTVDGGSFNSENILQADAGGF